jgi:uncharacterized membrane protein
MKASPHSHSRRPLDSHQRLGIALVAGIVAALLLQGRVHSALQLVLSWDVFATVSLSLAWLVIARYDPYELRRNARLQDWSRTLLFAAVLLAAVASLVAVGLMLGIAKAGPARDRAAPVVASFAAVALSWGMVHTLFALRYAHRYYDGAETAKRDGVAGGLLFPGKELPDFLDIAYFSFVIGMTCQVSDVQICSRRLRHLALLHGLIAFAFNTAILALAVNIAAGLF